MYNNSSAKIIIKYHFFMTKFFMAHWNSAMFKKRAFESSVNVSERISANRTPRRRQCYFKHSFHVIESDLNFHVLLGLPLSCKNSGSPVMLTNNYLSNYVSNRYIGGERGKLTCLRYRNRQIVYEEKYTIIKKGRKIKIKNI